MAKPATEARLAAAANGFTEIIGRGNSHIITKNPTTGKCAYDGQVGAGWHYNGDQETDTAWEADADQNYLKMVKAGYNLRARKLFNAGDLTQWTDPVSGQYVKFQPQNFQWIDGTTGSNSLISVAQAISAPTVDDDKLYWPAAFGSGRHFRYTAAPTKLIKHLIIDSAANLPACPTWITNPWLELTFTLTPSSGVTMYVDGVVWDQAKAKTTANAIEFRLPSGQVVWSMAAPLAYDSSAEGIPCNGQIKLYVNKKIKYCSVRFPKSWIDSAVFPIMLDPTLDYQISAGGNDGTATGSDYINYWYDMRLGKYYTYGYDSALRFLSVTIPDGATIDAAYLSFYFISYGGTPQPITIYAELGSNPAAPSSYSNYWAKTRTTASVSYTPASSGTWMTTGNLSAIITELLASHSFAAGSAMQFFLQKGANNGYSTVATYETDPAKAAKLSITYTEAAGGNPFYAYAQQ